MIRIILKTNIAASKMKQPKLIIMKVITTIVIMIRKKAMR